MHRPDHAEAILRRAAQIEATASDPAATLTDADLVEAGKAAGLSEEAVRQAIAEQRLAPAPRPNDADELRWTVTRRVPRLTDGQRAELFSTVRRAAPYRAYGLSAQIETFGEAQQWTGDVPMMGTWARLRVAPDGDGDVWTTEHYAALDVMGLVWMMGFAGAMAGGLLGAIASGGLGLPVFVGVLLAVLVTVAAVMATPNVRRRILARRRRQFDALVADLDRVAPADRTPAPTAERAAEPKRTPQLSLDADAPETEHALPQRLRART